MLAGVNTQLFLSCSTLAKRNITHLMGQSKPTVHLCGVRSIVTKLELALGLFSENTCIGQVKKG